MLNKLAKAFEKFCASAGDNTRDHVHEYSRLVMKKYRDLEACLCLANLLLPLFAQQTHQCPSKSTISANCLLSRSCHHWITPYTIRQCMRMRVCVLALTRRGRLLHPRVSIQAARVTSLLLALVCQVTHDRYCMTPPS